MNQQVKWIFDTRPVDTPYLTLVEDTTEVAEKQPNFWDEHGHWVLLIVGGIIGGWITG